MADIYSSPVPVGSRFTSGFMTRARPDHAGSDWAPPKPGQHVPIYAVSDGVVEAVGETGGLKYHTGRYVKIDHGKRTGNGSTDHTVTYYGHLQTILVSRGQWVRAGEKIGIMGATGNVTGVHLHLVVLFNGRYSDPKRWLKSKGIVPGKTKPVSAAAKTYTVRPGDTLSAIAAAHRTTADKLAALNGIKNKNLISVGQKIKLS